MPAPSVAHTGRAAHSLRARGLLLSLAVVAWLGGIGGGLAVLAAYANRAPESVQVSETWPTHSRLPRDEGKTTLIVFMHPKCPCSSATLTELNRIVARARGELTVTVAFYSPSSEPEGWGRTSLRDEAAAIPGVRVVDDPDGREAALFGAVNSGHVVLYAPNGRLLFHGGITASRAHEGDNLGEDSVVAAINGAAPTATTTPTYGCELTSGCDIPVCPQCDERSGS